MKEAFKILNKVAACLRLLNDAHLGQGDKKSVSIRASTLCAVKQGDRIDL